MEERKKKPIPLPLIVLVIKNLNDNGTISVFRSAVKKEETE